MRAVKAQNLPKTLRFTPSAEDWRAAQSGSATQCTLAVAVRRLHPSVTYVNFTQIGATLTFRRPLLPLCLEPRRGRGHRLYGCQEERNS